MEGGESDKLPTPMLMSDGGVESRGSDSGCSLATLPYGTCCYVTIQDGAGRRLFHFTIPHSEYRWKPQ